MKKKNTITQIVAFLALIWIVIWIIWTWILVYFSGWISSNHEVITENQYLDLQDIINEETGSVLEVQSGSIIEETIETLTWETE